MIIDIILIESVFALNRKISLQLPSTRRDQNPSRSPLSIVEGPGRGIHLFGFLGNVQGGQKPFKRAAWEGWITALEPFWKMA